MASTLLSSPMLSPQRQHQCLCAQDKGNTCTHTHQPGERSEGKRGRGGKAREVLRGG